MAPPQSPEDHLISCLSLCVPAPQLKYRKDLNKMKGTSHFHSLMSEDNLALKKARQINNIVSEVWMPTGAYRTWVKGWACQTILMFFPALFFFLAAETFIRTSAITKPYSPIYIK